MSNPNMEVPTTPPPSDPSPFAEQEVRELSLDEYIRITAIEAASRTGPNTWVVNTETTLAYLERAKAFENYIKGR